MATSISQALGKYFLNGKDLYGVFGIIPGPGSSDGFLQFPARKDSTTHDWGDSNGVDTDLSRTFLKQKEVSMKCSWIAYSTSDYWAKYDAFFAELIKPGTQRLTITELERDFYIYYKEVTGFTRLTRLQNSTKVGCQFALTVVEQEPKVKPDTIYLMADNGNFIVT